MHSDITFHCIEVVWKLKWAVSDKPKTTLHRKLTKKLTKTKVILKMGKKTIITLQTHDLGIAAS